MAPRALQTRIDMRTRVRATRRAQPEQCIMSIPKKCLITVEMGKATEVGRKVRNPHPTHALR